MELFLLINRYELIFILGSLEENGMVFELDRFMFHSSKEFEANSIEGFLVVVIV
ncbi:hypothetical protein YC2023_122502 [Brassica napus]